MQWARYKKMEKFFRVITTVFLPLRAHFRAAAHVILAAARLIEMIKEDNTDFYNKYKAARVIKDLGGSQKVKGKVEDAVVVTTEKETASAK
jgi:hypothetical protein